MCVSKKENMFEDPKVVIFFQFVGVDIDVDVGAGVIFHVILPAAHTAGRQVLDVSVLLHLPET